MKRILITGATGNIGRAVIHFLRPGSTDDQVIAGVRNPSASRAAWADFPALQYAEVDFARPESFDAVLPRVDIVFLLRPPQLADVDRYFRPLIAKMQQHGVRQVMFLSVQGAERSKVIPHNQIERLIREANLEYVFLRPSYFMQNLTTTLLGDIQARRQIILPAGQAVFNWVDVENIGEAAAILLRRFEEFRGQALEITGYENETFGRVAEMIDAAIEAPLHYRRVSPWRFFQIKRQEGVSTGLIVVMIMLHFLPRFQRAPAISQLYEQLTGQPPTSLATFVEREKQLWEA
jgi:uncharacterized protein YbjT (DUF2867 family)